MSSERIVSISFALCILLGIASSVAAKDRDWKIGRVLDSKSAKTYVQTGASIDSDGSEAKIHTMAIQETQLLIAGDEYAYLINDPVERAVGLATHGIVTRSIKNHGHGCRFIVGDDIKYFQDKAKLFVIDADRKECKLDIVRQERMQNGSQTRAGQIH